MFVFFIKTFPALRDSYCNYCANTLKKLGNIYEKLIKLAQEMSGSQKRINEVSYVNRLRERK